MTRDHGDDSEDEGTLLGANLYISVLKIRKLNMKIPVDVQMTVSIEVGDIELSTEPVYYDSGFALWPNERFAMYGIILFRFFLIIMKAQFMM